MLNDFRRLAIFAVLWLTGAAALSQPNAFWCGSRLIREGMAASEIVSRCGQPSSVDVVEEPVFARTPNGGRVQTGVEVIEYWTYDRGSSRFPALLTVRDGVAEQVELLRR